MLRPWLGALLQRLADRLVPPVSAARLEPASPPPANLADADLRPFVRLLLERFGADGVALIVIRDTGLESYRRAYATGLAPWGDAELLSAELCRVAERTLNEHAPAPLRVRN